MGVTLRSSRKKGFSLIGVLTAGVLLLTAGFTLFRFNHNIGIRTTKDVEIRNQLRAKAWAIAQGSPIPDEPGVVNSQTGGIRHLKVTDGNLTFFVIAPEEPTHLSQPTLETGDNP
jgi:hypothetical protein